ncbi:MULTISPECIES: ABC transporter substrate-binding protein [unclassified Rhodococcus (in: high G+C Gram-positive bacteria)]|nr:MULTISPECIES: ABC transporter substrate-binding protein [unclassified Rhodococcus (in: high G+C Gram-positive bacteria)]
MSIPVLLGQEKGLFREEGIVVEQVAIENSPAGIAAVQSGSADIALMIPSTGFPAIQDSGQLKAMTSLFGIDYTLLADPSLELPNANAPYPGFVKDFAGLTIGVTVRGGAAEAFVTRMLNDAGIDPSEVTFIATGGGASAAASFGAKQIDILFAEPPTQALVGEGNFVQIVDAKDAVQILGNNFYSFFSGNQRFLSDNEAAAASFCRGVRASVAWTQDPQNTDEVIAFTADTLNLTPEQASSVWNEYSSTFTTDALTEDGWNAALETVERGPAFSDVVFTPCQA